MNKITGSECLDYIEKPIAFVNKSYSGNNVSSYLNLWAINDLKPYEEISNNIWNWFAPCVRRGRGNQESCLIFQFNDNVDITKWRHDITKRKIGYVTEEYADGGIRVVVFGEGENAYYNNNPNFDRYQHFLYACGSTEYESHITTPTFTRMTLQTYPTIGDNLGYVAQPSESIGCLNIGNNISVGFDDMLDYKCDIPTGNSSNYPATCFTFQNGNHYLTDDLNTTMIFGQGLESQTAFYFDDTFSDPLFYLQGDLFGLLSFKMGELFGLCPNSFQEGYDMTIYKTHQGNLINSTNLVAIPYNLLLTKNYDFAQEYLHNGTLPPDAFLYPLDWNNLPIFNINDLPDEEDTPTSYDPENDPDDISRDIDPNLPQDVSYTVNQFTNYNWYWLDISNYYNFINWFWHDIGDYNDFDDIIAKIEGLYNDVASAVIMARYYPVDISWIGGLGQDKNIKLGMIEKAGAVNTINQSGSLTIQTIGSVNIPQKYKSFLDLPPYSQLTLYLPFHGFIDLDCDLFVGHKLTVKAIYDYMSGTIQYYIIYDDSFTVNTILCKMAMDIPITLQTKNDRDSTIFNNVANTIGGLIGAGVGIASGNPIGMTLGITQGVSAFNSANASAPMRMLGNVGESGAYLGPQHCYIMIRRPTIQPSDGKKSNPDIIKSADSGLTTWRKNVGQMCGFGYKLSNLSGMGLTVCHNPRIVFNASENASKPEAKPYQTEVDEIYTYLKEGVIL